MKKAYGWSLIELLIVLALFTLLAAAGIPGFRNNILRQESEQAANLLINAVKIAQSQASFEKKTITICPVTNMQCSKSAQSLAIFLDINNNRNIDSDDEILRYIKVTDGTHTIRIKASFGREYFRFAENGFAMEAGSLIYCTERPDRYGEVIRLNYAGRAYIIDDKKEKEKALDCPS